MSPGLSSDQLSGYIEETLKSEGRLEIEGLGTFIGYPGKISFVPERGDRIFIAYANEDATPALALFEELKTRGYQPWVDRKKLLAGQSWPRSIEHAISISDFFIPCFSRMSIAKRGYFHAELRYALECARQVPLDEIFLIPVRLDSCSVPSRISRETQYIDLFPEWTKGIDKIVSTIEEQRCRRLPKAS